MEHLNWALNTSSKTGTRPFDEPKTPTSLKLSQCYGYFCFCSESKIHLPVQSFMEGLHGFLTSGITFIPGLKELLPGEALKCDCGKRASTPATSPAVLTRKVFIEIVSNFVQERRLSSFGLRIKGKQISI